MHLSLNRIGFMFFFSGSKVIVTNAFHKKTNKLPAGEKQRALKCKEDYEIRVNQR